MSRRAFSLALASAAALPVIAACSDGGSTGGASGSSTGSTSATTTGSSSLAFPKDAYTEETKTVSTAAGDRKVTYRYYAAIPYVANPVDVTYQSLNVSVPVSIDGKAVDATGAPVLLDIPVGGYMSAPVSGGGAAGGAPSGAAPSGAVSSGAGPSGAAPSGMSSGSGQGGVPAGSGAMTGGGTMVSNGDLALAAGYVVVKPGVRGRDNVAADGTYFGKAPAAIVDLKAVVRYLRHNKGVVPGNTDRIVSSGTSAGGALSALLGASGDSDLYQPYLEELGAADASDAVFASADYCPITDLEHADMAYEWMFGTTALGTGKVVDQAVSKELAAAFTDYQASLGLKGKDGFGTVTAANYGDYLRRTYLEPAATRYLAAQSASARASYLAKNTWISWSGTQASFSFADFVKHVGRMKSVPAFDDFNLSQAEPIEFGNETKNARHFTLYSLRHAGGATAELDSDLPEKINLMNPMYFVRQKNAGRAKHWWIRVGTSDTNTSLTVAGNLALGLENLGDDVSSVMYWDAGHGANEDADEFITWIGSVTGYRK